MILQIINNSDKTIDLSIGNHCAEIAQTFQMEITEKKANVSIVYHDASDFISDNKQCFIETKISFDLLCNKDAAILLVANCVRKYQNNTLYSFFIPQCNDGKIINVRYSVSNLNQAKEHIKHYSPGRKISRILSLLSWCLFDTILDGGLLFLILWFVFNIQIAVTSLAIVFIVELAVQFLFRKLNKSRHRFLNWAKDINSFDDVEYLIRHIQKFCK